MPARIIELEPTSLTEMLQLPNFGRRTKPTIHFVSREKILLVMLLTEIVTSEPFFQNTFLLRRPREAIFAESRRFNYVYQTKF